MHNKKEVTSKENVDLKSGLGELAKYIKKYLPLIIPSLILAALSSVFSIIGPDKLKDMTDTIANGLMTGIDLDKESTGIKGKLENAGLLMNLAIGQYDSYTNIELNQYIATLANGKNRFSLHLLKEIKKEDNVIKKFLIFFQTTKLMRMFLLRLNRKTVLLKTGLFMLEFF